MSFRELTLFSSRLKEQFSFYSEVLGLDILRNENNFFSIRIGKTVVHFHEKTDATSYHFAINIPSNKILEAHQWLKNRTEILPDGEKEIIDFKNWNAESVYFHDPDKNIVELIARKNLKILSETIFSGRDFLEVSEIGVAVENVESAYNDLNRIIKTPVYWGDFNVFCAAGDEHGLLILINRNKKKWFPSGEEAHASPFMLRSDVNIEFKNGQLYSI